MKKRQPVHKTVRCLSLLAIGMFGFSFALVPLYDVLCKATGLNGKVDLNGPSADGRYRISPDQIPNRLVTIEFDVTHNKDMPWIFRPKHSSLQVRPGEVNSTSYYVKNTTEKTMVAQAIPSITPGIVAIHFKKLECFCFEQQLLHAGQEAEMPLRFVLDTDFPHHIHRLTLSYTLFDMTERIKEERIRG
jgi:cytochrome c oxidase assembly protein subunit 11